MKSCHGGQTCDLEQRARIPTHVFAKFLNLNVLSRASPSLVRAHRPPDELSSGFNAAVMELSSEPFEKRGCCDDIARMGTLMGGRAVARPVRARVDNLVVGRNMCD